MTLEIFDVMDICGMIKLGKQTRSFGLAQLRRAARIARCLLVSHDERLATCADSAYAIASAIKANARPVPETPARICLSLTHSQFCLAGKSMQGDELSFCF